MVSEEKERECVSMEVSDVFQLQRNKQASPHRRN